MRQFGPGTILATALVTGLIVKLAARAHHMGPGHHRYGRHGSWEQQTVPERFRPMLERWHREAHADSEADPAAAASDRPSPSQPPVSSDSPA